MLFNNRLIKTSPDRRDNDRPKGIWKEDAGRPVKKENIVRHKVATPCTTAQLHEWKCNLLPTAMRSPDLRTITYWQIFKWFARVKGSGQMMRSLWKHMGLVSSGFLIYNPFDTSCNEMHFRIVKLIVLHLEETALMNKMEFCKKYFSYAVGNFSIILAYENTLACFWYT